MKIFDKNLHFLLQLFSEKEVVEKIDRLKYIFENTESSWMKNLELFRNQEIKYILICEAPPYSETEIPEYFYNQTNRKFNSIIWKVFFENEKKPNSDFEYYKKLAEKGFLLIDNLPYSMNYNSTIRKKITYKKLIENSLEWFLENVQNEKIKISKEVKIAFGFKLNALTFMEITKGKINLKNNIVSFNEKNIGVNTANYPDTNLISNIFFSKLENEFSKYKYFNGESENPYFLKGGYELDFSNPKSLFWHYEKGFYGFSEDKKNYQEFIYNLIHNKLTEYNRNEYELWQLYFNNSIK